MRAKSSAFSFNREGFIIPKISKKPKWVWGFRQKLFSSFGERFFFCVSRFFFLLESRFNLVADVAISGEQAGSASGLTVPDKRSAPS